MASLEPAVYQAIIAGISGIVLFSLGFFVNTFTGKNRSEVRKFDGDASKSYSEAAKNAADMMVDLQRQVTELSKRVDTLESEKDALQNQIIELQIENAQLRQRLDRGKGLATK